VGFLMAAVLLVVIPEATLLLFGEVWLPIVPIFRLMAIYVVLDPLYINLSYLALGLGHPEALSRTRLLQLGLFAIAVPALACLWGVRGIAVAADLMILCGVLALLRFACRHLRFSLGEMMTWPLVALAVSGAVGAGLTYGVAWKGPWPALVVMGTSVAVVYGLVLCVTEWQAVRKDGEWVLRAFGFRIGGADNQDFGVKRQDP
jgi:O-antigen/teichoic acid export membrane protein